MLFSTLEQFVKNIKNKNYDEIPFHATYNITTVDACYIDHAL